MDQNEIPNDPRHLGVRYTASKMVFEAMVYLAQTKLQSCVKISTFYKRTKKSFLLSLEPRSAIRCVKNNFCAYDMFSANSAPILQQHKHCLQMDGNEIPHDPRHLGVLSGASKMISEPMVHSAQTAPLSCIKISAISKQTKSSFHLSLIT
jgi:hypothetical protein